MARRPHRLRPPSEKRNLRVPSDAQNGTLRKYTHIYIRAA